MRKTIAIIFVLLLHQYISFAQQFGDMNTFMRNRSNFYGYSQQEWGDKWFSSNRLEYGFGMPFQSFFLEGNYESFDGNTISDNHYFVKVPLKPLYSFVAGYSYPMAKLSEKSVLAITVDVSYAAFKGDNFSIKLSQNRSFSTMSIKMTGLPVSIDYKSGTDAVFDKQYRFMYTFGIGFQPTLTQVDDDDMFKIYPFVKAEAGIFAGIAFKVRATLTIAGIRDYYEDREDNGLPNVPQDLKLNYSSSLTTEPQLNLSLIIMPFSFLWEKYK